MLLRTHYVLRKEGVEINVRCTGYGDRELDRRTIETLRSEREVARQLELIRDCRNKHMTSTSLN